MNRERLLFAFVLAFLALWFLLLREKPVVVDKVRPARGTLTRRDVKSAAYPRRVLTLATKQTPFTRVTNVVDYPRPELAKAVSEYLSEPVPKPFPLASIWPPTSRCVSLDRLGRLRRWPAAPTEDEPTIELPVPPERADDVAAPESAGERIDTWLSFKQEQRGRVLEIFAGRERYRPGKQLPSSLAALKAPENRFWLLLLLLEVDPDRAAEVEGVTDVRARIQGLGDVKQRLRVEITEFRVGIEGKHQGWFSAAKRYIRLPAGADARQRLGRTLLQEGVRAGDKELLRAALEVLGEAKERIPAAGAQTVRRAVVLLMLDAANRLNRQELVLQLAFEHLAAFPDEEDVLEYVGNITASRSFNLLELAAEFFERARNSTYAQQRLVEVRIALGEFDEAREVLDSGRAGAGADVDLLRARVALALGDLETASDRARRHTTSSDPAQKAEAHQILGAVAYVEGDAAQAAQQFLEAVAAAPARSTAYSDLGFALAVQGKAKDAQLCFDRALQLDPIDNSVAPNVGAAFLKLAAGDAQQRALDRVKPDPRDPEYFERKRAELRDGAAAAYGEAEGMLTLLQEDNPTELLVRFLLGYAKEKSGNLEPAAKLYRDTIDADHRYRIAIARLGLVQAALVEGGGSRELVPQAVAHLEKAVALNPKDAVLPYILGRFLLAQGEQRSRADEAFEKAQGLAVNEQNGDLPLWAQLGRAILAYRNESIEDRKIKAKLNELLLRIKDQMPAGATEKALMEHEVYRAAAIALEMVQETETKVNKTWNFAELATRPPDWRYHNKTPMRVSVVYRKGLVFGGEIDYAGRKNDFKTVLEYCAAEYNQRSELNGKTFFELVVEGHVPEATPAGVDFAVGLVNPGRTKTGPVGIQVRRKSRTGNAAIRLDGGKQQKFKEIKVKDYVEMKSVPWPKGDFRLHIKVKPEYGNRRSKGRFYLTLNGVNVFEQEFGEKTESCQIFSRGRSNQQILIYLWVEGTEGRTIPDIYVTKVTVTMSRK